jgi:hypothetical protein
MPPGSVLSSSACLPGSITSSDAVMWPTLSPQATARRALRSLRVLAVRPADAQGEPGEGQAVSKAGEPCTVW